MTRTKQVLASWVRVTGEGIFFHEASALALVEELKDDTVPSDCKMTMCELRDSDTPPKEYSNFLVTDPKEMAIYKICLASKNSCVKEAQLEIKVVNTVLLRKQYMHKAVSLVPTMEITKK